MTSKAGRLARTAIILLTLSVSIVGCASVHLADRPLTKEQKVEDFRHLSRVFLEGHPFLWAAQRKTSYDWAAHLDEFEARIAATQSDEEFVLEMARILRLLNNGHTGILPGWGASLYGGFLNGLVMKRWKTEVRKTTAETADFWADLANWYPKSSQFSSGPFHAVYAGGKYIVVSVSPEVAQAETCVQPGWIVTAIDGVPVNEYVAGFLSKQSLSFDPVRKCLYQRSLSLPSAGGADVPSTVDVSFLPQDGGATSFTLPAKVTPWDPGYSWPPKYKEATANVDTATDNMLVCLLDGDVAYVRIRSMLQSSREDMKLLRRFMTASNPEALIIDIRGNQGGSDNYWEALVSMLTPEEVSAPIAMVWRSGDYVQSFIEEKGTARLGELPRSKLEARSAESAGTVPPEILTGDFAQPRLGSYTVKPDNGLNFRGKVCLLVDDYVFSSSESFAVFCKGSKWATVIGSCTGGDGIGYDPALVALPNSGMLIRFPLVMGLNSDLSANEEQHTKPDVLVEWGPEDLLRYVATGGKPVRPDPAWDPQLRAALEWIASH